MDPPKTEATQPEEAGWIEVPSKRKKNKDAPAAQQQPAQGHENSQPRVGGKQGVNHGSVGARVGPHHSMRELTPEEEEKKKIWTAEEEGLKAKVVIGDDFDWSVGLALAKKSPEPVPAAGAPAPSSTWSKMLFPGNQKSQAVGPAVSRHVVDKPLSLIGGMHTSVIKNDPKRKNNWAIASFVVCAFPSLEVVYEVIKEVPLQEPFISGFYSFRDVGPLVALFNELKEAKPELVPQLILVDGPGINYRGFGLATHLGVLLGIPTVGVTKKFFSVDGLNDQYVRNLMTQELQKRGEAIELIGRNSGAVLGAGMRTTDGPRGAHVFITVGHRIGLPTAVEVVREACLGKVPQPIHLAQYAVKQELLKSDPKVKSLQGNAGGKGGNKGSPRVGNNANNREGGFKKGGGFRKDGGKNFGGLANGAPQDGGNKRTRGPRPQGDGQGQGQGNRAQPQGRGFRSPQGQQGQDQNRSGQGQGQGRNNNKGGNKGGQQRGGSGGQQGNQAQQQGNNQQGGQKRTGGGPRNNNRGGASPKQANVWAQKVPNPAPAGGAATTAAPAQPAAASGDQQRPTGGKQGGKSQQKQPAAVAGEKGEEKAQAVPAQKDGQAAGEKKD